MEVLASPKESAIVMEIPTSPKEKCDCAGNTEDYCGVCGGPGIPEGKCDCRGSTACLSTEDGTLIAPDDALELTKAYKNFACDIDSIDAA